MPSVSWVEKLRASAQSCDEVILAQRPLRRMRKSRVSDLSVARNELIKKGLVYAPERGMLAFTVPGMHEFVLRQDGQEID